MRLIDADAFENYVFDEWKNNEVSNGDWIQFREWLKDQDIIVEFDGEINKVIVNGEEYYKQPTIDAVPVVHGRWLWYEDCSNSGLYCSACHKLIHKVMRPKKKLSRYCPNCGAKMDGGAEP